MRSIFKRWSKTWFPEVIAYFLVLAGCAAIVALFIIFNGRTPPDLYISSDWSVSLPALTTLPTRLVENLLEEGLRTVINQLSVLRFVVPRRLKELEIYNQATRSIRGAPGLIRVAPFSFASLAAIVAIIQPLITTTVQLAISQHTELLFNGTRPVPICQRLSIPPTDFGLEYQGVSDETIRAMWNGLTASDSITLSIKVGCAGANKCVWDNYSTIALDYQCQDITSSVVRTCSDGSTSNCTFTVPATQLTLQNQKQRYISSAYLPAPFFNDTPWYFAAWQMMGLPGSEGNETALAAQCMIFPVVNTYTAQYARGEFTETLLSSWHNETGPTPILPQTPEWLMTPGGTVNGTFSISQNSYAIPFANKNLDFFKGSGNISWNGIDYHLQDQHQRLHSSLLDGTLNQTISNLALALSTTIRNSVPYDSLYDSPNVPQTQAFGQAFRYAQLVRIRWLWLIPLAVAFVLFTVVLPATIYQSRKAKLGFLFKGDILAIFNMAPANKSNNAMFKATRSTDHQNSRHKRFVIRGKTRKRFRIVGSHIKKRP